MPPVPPPVPTSMTQDCIHLLFPNDDWTVFNLEWFTSSFLVITIAFVFHTRLSCLCQIFVKKLTSKEQHHPSSYYFKGSNCRGKQLLRKVANAVNFFCELMRELTVANARNLIFAGINCLQFLGE